MNAKLIYKKLEQHKRVQFKRKYNFGCDTISMANMLINIKSHHSEFYTNPYPDDKKKLMEWLRGNIHRDYGLKSYFITQYQDHCFAPSGNKRHCGGRVHEENVKEILF